MMSAHETIDEHIPARPPLFRAFAALSVIATVAWIAGSLVAAPGDRPMFHFGEDGAVTALSTVFMAMAAALALAVFYLRLADWSSGVLFWLVLAAGFAFLAIDEQLMLHERGGALLEETALGTPETFRNWNDLIVIAYGAVALAFGALFAREILRCRTFALLFGIAFAFYAVHTGIDAVLSSDVAWKDAPEESAKLFCALFLFLAVCARFVSLAGALGLASSKNPD